jgi:hypothetical protein
VAAAFAWVAVNQTNNNHTLLVWPTALPVLSTLAGAGAALLSGGRQKNRKDTKTTVVVVPLGGLPFFLQKEVLIGM